MDPRYDPYTPNAGAEPRELAGRGGEIAAFDVLLDRLENGLPVQSLLLTGWRGVGKTVLLRRLQSAASARGWATVDAEVAAGAPFAPKMAQMCRRALLSIAPSSRWADRTKRAAAVLGAFTVRVDPDGALTAGIDLEAAQGAGDSGHLAQDLTDVLIGLGEAAREHRTGIVIALDELHGLDGDTLAALITALHKTVQLSLPVTLIGAGLPRLRRQAAEAQSYAERLFSFPVLSELPPDAAVAALTGPAAQLGVDVEPEAADAVVAYTQGHPYLVQEFGSALWTSAPGPDILMSDVEPALLVLERRLDTGFFNTRADRATPAELGFMRAMAATGSEPCAVADAAASVGKTVRQVAPARGALVGKGLIHVPAPGQVAFTVPQFGAYLRRTSPG